MSAGSTASMSTPYGVPDADGVMRLDPARLRRLLAKHPKRKKPRHRRQKEPPAAAVRLAERQILRRLVAALVDLLDELDGDPDLEDSHDAEEQLGEYEESEQLSSSSDPARLHHYE